MQTTNENKKKKEIEEELYKIFIKYIEQNSIK